MPDCSDETSYYLNGKLPLIALIAKGVRSPHGSSATTCRL